MELREKIASLFAVARRAGAEDKPGDPDDFAALVLSIPEIAEALTLRQAIAKKQRRPRNVWQPVIPNA